MNFLDFAIFEYFFNFSGKIKHKEEIQEVSKYFFFWFYGLQSVKRWNTWGIPYKENDFEHVLNGLSFLETIKLHFNDEVFKMIVERWIHHDDVEIIAGDTVMCSYYGEKDLEKEKFQNESAAISEIKRIFPINCSWRIENIFLDYENLSSEIDVIVKIIDKIDAMSSMLKFPNAAILEKGRDKMFDDGINDYLCVLPSDVKKEVLIIRDSLKRKCDCIFK